jgi:hypothetical protein
MPCVYFLPTYLVSAVVGVSASAETWVVGRLCNRLDDFSWGSRVLAEQFLMLQIADRSACGRRPQTRLSRKWARLRTISRHVSRPILP